MRVYLHLHFTLIFVAKVTLCSTENLSIFFLQSHYFGLFKRYLGVQCNCSAATSMTSTRNPILVMSISYHKIKGDSGHWWTDDGDEFVSTPVPSCTEYIKQNLIWGQTRIVSVSQPVSVNMLSFWI